MRNSIKHIDVSDLPAPGPMEKVLALLSESSEQEIICMSHRQKPINLFPILVDRGFCYRLVEKENMIKLYIWNAKNTEARDWVEAEIKSVQ